MKGNSIGVATDRRPAVNLVLGFTAAAIALYALLSLVGARMLGLDRLGRQGWLLAAGVLGALLVVDLVRARRPGRYGPSWHRQTPKDLEERYGARAAALLWGLDAGLVVTTYRVTSLSWAALAVTALGLVPWWSGVVYAVGFTAPVAAMIFTVPTRSDPTRATDPEPTWLLERILDLRPPVKPAAFMALAAAGTACLLTATRLAG